MGNIVAIVGRPNVGKSTLFNRLTQTRQAIVNEEAGTTRDRQYGKAEWTGKEFSLIDTGGWVINSDDVFEEEINKQVKVALEEADVIFSVSLLSTVLVQAICWIKSLLRFRMTSRRCSKKSCPVSPSSAVRMQANLL